MGISERPGGATLLGLLMPPTPATVPPVGSAPSSGGGPTGGGPNSAAPAYVVAVCLFTSDISDKCVSSGKREGTNRLVESYLEAYAKERISVDDSSAGDYGEMGAGQVPPRA
jgi:hypothetical protein